MNLDHKSEENLEFILSKLAQKLEVANRFIMDPEAYSLDKYDELKSMYDLVMSRQSLSPSETQAFIAELRSARKA